MAASSYSIHDKGSLLVIQSLRPWKSSERIIAVAIPAIIVAFLLYQISASLPLVLFAAFTVGASMSFLGPSASTAEVRMSATEVHSKVSFSKRFPNGRTVCTGDILRLVYDDRALSFGDSLQHSGLYALVRSHRICLLPFLDYKQTDEIINTIEAKFPGLAEGWHKNSSSLD